MTDTAQNDGTTQQASQEGDGSPDAGTQNQKATSGEDPIALARKRQAGAEAARQQAEKQRDEALKELETFRAAQRSEADKDLADNAKLQERLAFEKRRADEAEARAEARILDFKYPNARAELPDVTDEVKLAKFEALLAETDAGSAEPPKPQNPNESNRSASGDATAKPPVEEKSEDILARLKQMGVPGDW